jgi:hypothetical protein
MTVRTGRLKLLARGLGVATALVIGLWVVVGALNDFRDIDIYYEVSNTLAYVAFSAVGLLIISRQPTNLIGWICALVGFLNFLGGRSNEYATYAYTTRGGNLPWKTAAVRCRSCSRTASP